MSQIEIQTRYDSKVFCRFYFFNILYKNGKYYFSNLIPLAMLLLALPALQHEQYGWSFLAVGVGILTPLLTQKLVQAAVRAQIKSCAGLEGKEVYRFVLTEESVTVLRKTELVESFGWAQLQRIYCLGKTLYLYAAPKNAYILDASQMSTTEWETLLQWIAQGGGEKMFRDRSKLLPRLSRWEMRI